MDPVIREIEIAVTGGTERVTAGVYGHVAVHRDIQPGLENHRTITHVGTGLAIKQKIDRSVAIQIAEQIGADPLWDFGSVAEFEKRKPSLRAKLDAAVRRATQPAAMMMPGRKNT